MSSQFPPPPPGGTPPPPPPPTSPDAPPPSYGAAPPPPGYQAYDPHGGTLGVARAGFWKRFLGFFVDNLLYGLLALALSIPGIVLTVASFDWVCIDDGVSVECEAQDVNGGGLALGVLLLVVAFLAVAFLYLRALGRTGQTWGRKIVGVKVIGKRTGQPIGFGRALGRQLFASFISGQILYLGYLWMLWDKDKQTWHDKIVDSIVVEV